jgi:hypothetical protein
MNDASDELGTIYSGEYEVMKNLLAALAVLILFATAAHSDLTLSIEPANPKQGEAAWVTVLGAPNAETMVVELLGKEFPLWRTEGGDWLGLIAIDRET